MIERKKFIRRYIKKLWTAIGFSYSFLCILLAVFPFQPVNKDTFGKRLLILIFFLVFAFVLALILFVISVNTKSITTYEKLKTKIVFEYGDFTKIISDCSKSNIVVIPVNTNLTSVFDKSAIRKGTIHHMCLEYLLGKDKNGILNLDYIKNIMCKSKGFTISAIDNKGKKGEFFLIDGHDISPDILTKFLFVEMFDSEIEYGKHMISEIEKEDYLSGLQSIMNVIPIVAESDEIVFLPLIGAGIANVEEPVDIMHIINAVLHFNKNDLNHEIHVVVYKALKKEIPIYQLEKY